MRRKHYIPGFLRTALRCQVSLFVVRTVVGAYSAVEQVGLSNSVAERGVGKTHGVTTISSGPSMIVVEMKGEGGGDRRTSNPGAVAFGPFQRSQSYR